MNLIDVLVSGIALALALVAEHYYFHTRQGRELKPPTTYVVGTATILTVVGALFIDSGLFWPFVSLVVVIAIGGAAVLLSYRIDRKKQKDETTEDLMEMVRLLREKLGRNEQADGS